MMNYELILNNDDYPFTAEAIRIVHSNSHVEIHGFTENSEDEILIFAFPKSDDWLIRNVD